MTENQKHLKEAQAHSKEFESEMEPERLREAFRALENVILAAEDDPKTRAQRRRESLELWLHLFQLLDRSLDPKFNPNDVPGKLVQPPQTSGGVVYPPGADPALIDDPKARAQYEKAIAANRAKANGYRLQLDLRRLDERVTPRVEAFIRNAYTSAPGDQEELRTAIERSIRNPHRKAGLLEFLRKGSAQGAKPMEEHLVGRSISLSEAAMQASLVMIAEVVEVGSADLGAPGQTSWDKTKLRIIEPLKGKTADELLIAYTVQTIPAAIAERAPKKEERLIFFLEIRKDQPHRAIKVVLPTPDHLKQLHEILGIKPHQKVREWLMKAPFDDPSWATDPNFSYEDWFDEGRALPQSVEILIELLEKEELDRPSGLGMSTAYALAWIGDKRKRGIDALLRALESRDIALRVEAAAALGRLGDATVLPTLEDLLTDEKEDINVRANACIAIGRLGVPSSEKLLRDTLKTTDPFLARCAEEALRLHAAGKSSQRK